MAHIHFHCSSPKGVLLDQRGSDVENMIEAHERAVLAIRTLVALPSPEDWRNWLLHASDEEGEEVFVMSFASVLGRPH